MVPKCPTCPHAAHRERCNAIVSGAACGCATITTNFDFSPRAASFSSPRRVENGIELPIEARIEKLIEVRIAKIEGELRNLKTWIEEQKDLVRRRRELEEKAQREREAEEKERADRLRQQEAGGFSELDLGPLTKRD